MKLLIVILSLAVTAFAQEPDVDFNLKWEYTKLHKRKLNQKFSTKYFKRFIKAGRKAWPVSEVMYTQFEPSKKKINLQSILKNRIKTFEKVEWQDDRLNQTIIKRGFWKKGNRVVEVYVWKRPYNGYGVLTTLTRKPYIKSINKELVFIHNTLINPKSKITEAANIILNTAYAQDNFAGANTLFGDAIITSAMETGLIPVLTNEGGTVFVTTDEATEAQLAIWENEKGKFLDHMKAEEQRLRDQEKEARREARELEAQAKEEEEQERLAQEKAEELREIEEALARQEELIENYKSFDDKLQKERIKIIELEIMADKLWDTLQDLETQNDPDVSIEDLIIKYSSITGREPQLDCVDCIQGQLIEFNTGSMNRLLNFLHQARLDGRDPKMAFCKKLEAIIDNLIQLEHFNQEARSIILAAENEVYRGAIDEVENIENRYAQLNSRDHLRERADLRNQMDDIANRAEKQWIKDNRNDFIEACRKKSTSGLPPEASNLVRSSWEKAQTIIDEHNPIEDVGDFFWQFFCWGKRCQLKKACKEVFDDFVRPKSDDRERSDARLSVTPEQLTAPMDNAKRYFDAIRVEMECYSKLRVTYGARGDNVHLNQPGNSHKYSNPNDGIDPSRVTQCQVEGAEDAIRLYNLKIELLDKFNQEQCPKKIEEFYQGLSSQWQTNHE